MRACVCVCLHAVGGPLCLFISKALFCNCSKCWGCICIHPKQTSILPLIKISLSVDGFCVCLRQFECVCEKKCERNRPLCGGIQHYSTLCAPLIWQAYKSHMARNAHTHAVYMSHTLWGHSWWKNKAYQTNWQILAVPERERAEKEGEEVQRQQPRPWDVVLGQLALCSDDPLSSTDRTLTTKRRGSWNVYPQRVISGCTSRLSNAKLEKPWIMMFVAASKHLQSKQISDQIHKSSRANAWRQIWINTFWV